MNENMLAEYILEWLCRRNEGQLRDVFEGELTVAEFRLLKEELALILLNRGKPSNWVE